jgi:hypothetical protein
MSSGRNHSFRALAILLLIAGTFTLQAASFLPGHVDDHASHCCAVCHLAHVSLVNPAQVLSALAPSVDAWFVRVEESLNYKDARAADTRSRAPPVQAVVSL